MIELLYGQHKGWRGNIILGILWFFLNFRKIHLLIIRLVNRSLQIYQFYIYIQESRIAP